MKNSIDLKNIVIDLLKDEIDIENSSVVEAFERKSIDLPVKNVIVSVGVDSQSVTVENNRDVRNIYDNRIDIPVNIFTPLKSGGEYCAQVISGIKDILSSGVNESNFKIISSGVSHSSQTMAYSGEILISFFDASEESGSLSEYDNIVFYINGNKNLASKIQVLLDMKHLETKSYGEGTVYKNNLISMEYVITIHCNKEIIISDYTQDFTIYCVFSEDNKINYYNGVLKEFNIVNNYNNDNSFQYVFKCLERG